MAAFSYLVFSVADTLPEHTFCGLILDNLHNLCAVAVTGGKTGRTPPL